MQRDDTGGKYYITRGWRKFCLDNGCEIGDLFAFNVVGDGKTTPLMCYLLVGATSSTALHKQCKETILVNKEGNSWNVSLRFSESGGKYYITRGWRKFCLDNGCEIGDLFAFNVVGDGKTTPLMCYLPVGATSSTALHKQCKETILVNKEGNSWNVNLRFSESGGKYYITRGWRKFCLDNRCEIGNLFAFNVVGDGKTTP
ncbi:B3 domain-containing protein REM10-like [Brassica napus]|uniref:B3 domain-containing protein REM10-like n=1 Tax=Brassica napus TaxID=3708 RepID=UPI002078C40E|nr:B3 domain-containing protein REM10-like [Brassica napus]